MRLLVTGAAGFIGSCFARQTIAGTQDELLVFDKLTYAGNLDNLAPVSDDQRDFFEAIFLFRRSDFGGRGNFSGGFGFNRSGNRRGNFRRRFFCHRFFRFFSLRFRRGFFRRLHAAIRKF